MKDHRITIRQHPRDMSDRDVTRSRRRATPRAITVLAAGLMVASMTALPGRASTTGGPRAWGSNNFGQLGLGNDAANSSRVNNPIPLPVPSLLGSALTAVAGGTSHSLALKADNTVWAWGSNSGGQLGDGTNGTNKSTPVQVKTGATTNLTGALAVAGGGAHSVAVKDNGASDEAWAWGLNDKGQLGDNTTTNSAYAVPVKTGATTNLTGVLAVAAGRSHSLAVKDETNDTVWAWGDNDKGQLGNSSTTASSLAVQVKNGTGASDFLTGVSAVAGGGRHSLALRSGEVWAWGSNDSGELGDAATCDLTLATNCESTIATKVRTNTTLPATYLSGVVAVAAGHSHSLALKSDGTVWAWGDNSQGQLGRATTCDPFTTPPTNCTSTFAAQVLTSPLTALSGVAAIGGGGLHSLALKSDGTAWSWGRNIEGQLGYGAAGLVTAASNSNTARPVAELSGVTKIAGGGLHSLAYVP